MKVLFYRAMGWYPSFRSPDFIKYPELSHLDTKPVNIEMLLECQKGYWLVSQTFKKDKAKEIAQKLTLAYETIIETPGASAQEIRAFNNELFTHTVRNILYEDSLNKLARTIITKN